MEEIYVGPSEREEEWSQALWQEDNESLNRLVNEEPPGVVFFHLTVFIEGLYGQMKLTDDLRAKIVRIQPIFRALRQHLDWRQQRELFIGIMRWIKSDGCLSIVIGAGATIAAGGPSWMELVYELLKLALEKGHEISKLLPTSDETTFVKKHIRTEHFNLEDSKEAENILKMIESHDADIEALMRGAELCEKLFGVHIIQHINNIIYLRASKPSQIHEAIAKLAQPVVRAGKWRVPGWASIISYNFDNLMGDALKKEKIPHVAWAIDNEGKTRGHPDELAKKLGPDSLYQSIYHVHGYTPWMGLGVIYTGIVLSESEYTSAYGSNRLEVLDDIVKNYLMMPRFICLYVGCSFIDEAMNSLLREAATISPGRFHYAFLRLPEEFQEKEPSSKQLEDITAPYLEMGIQPVWFQNYNEIPSLILKLGG
ncbi:MAG: SIR2 family protein [Promethearchaeota archaeon]